MLAKLTNSEIGNVFGQIFEVLLLWGLPIIEQTWKHYVASEREQHAFCVISEQSFYAHKHT